MRSLTIRLPERLIREIEAESRKRNRPKSEVVRERLERGANSLSTSTGSSIISDLIGSVDGLPSDVSGRKKAYLRVAGYCRKPNR